MCNALLPPGVNPIAVNKYIKYVPSVKLVQVKANGTFDNANYEISGFTGNLFRLNE
jgi:hypothetical protein